MMLAGCELVGSGGMLTSTALGKFDGSLKSLVNALQPAVNASAS
jgi:hypothetical protein